MDNKFIKKLMDDVIGEIPRKKYDGPSLRKVSWLEAHQGTEGTPFLTKSGLAQLESLVADSIPPIHGNGTDWALWASGEALGGLGPIVYNKLMGGERGAISRGLNTWLKNTGVDEETRKKLIRINEDIELNDKPGSVIKDDNGNVLFSSNNNAAHVIRQAIANDDFARKYAEHPELNMTNNQLRDNVVVGLLHDIGKSRTPEDVLNRARNFPPEGMTYADMQNTNYTGGLGDLMNNVVKRNSDPETKYVGGLSDNDFDVMKNHVNKWEEATQHYQVPEELSKKANMHHLHYDGNPRASYPKEFADIKRKAIPVEARIQSIFDSADAIASPRYGVPGVKNFDELMSRLSSNRGESSIGTQFDSELFGLADNGGFIKNYYDNIANKEGYKLAKLIKSHRTNTYGKSIADELSPEVLQLIYQLGLHNSINRKD